jgi:epoxyqueuosine reductase
VSVDLKSRMVAEALAMGFAKVRVTRLDAIPQAAGRLAEWLAAGHHGQMAWMADRAAWRGDPAALWADARSVVMLAEIYTPDGDPLATLAQPDVGTISVYARNRDYHDVAKARAKRLARWLVDQGGGVKVFVDTAPVMEKPLAAAAGLGWQGKHTNLLARDLGNFFFLAAVFTTLEFDPDPAETDHCGTCTACLDVCPTQAFPAPRVLDARRCVSYLTIEHRGPVPEDLREGLGNRIYGCDDCLAVCPWNKFAAAATEVKYAARDDLRAPPLADLAQLDDAAFRARFAGSPIKRIGRDRFVRNVLYAIGNSGLPPLRAVAADRLGDADDAVRDAAAWSVARLS